MTVKNRLSTLGETSGIFRVSDLITMHFAHAKHADRVPIRSALAGVAVIVLMVLCGPWIRVSSGSSRSESPSPRPACCCGPTCSSAKCCCTPLAKPSKSSTTPPPSSSSETTVQAELLAIASASSACIGPMPCGGDQEATTSLMSPRERPANLATWDRPDAVKARPPLPSFIDRFSSELPGDLPDEPPESSRIGVLA